MTAGSADAWSLQKLKERLQQKETEITEPKLRLEKMEQVLNSKLNGVAN